MQFWESIGENLLQALGWTVVHAIWQGALIAILVAITFALLPRKAAAIRYKVAYAGLMVMTLWSLGTFVSQLSQPEHLTIVYEDHIHQERTTIIIDGVDSFNGGWIASIKDQMHDYIPWIAFVWVLGALFFSMRWLGSYAYLRHLRRQASLINDGAWQSKIDKIGAYFGLKRKVWLMSSHQVDSPMVIGHLKPIILIPVGFLTAMTPSQVETILVHELAHVRRHDYLLNMIQQVLEVLFFYHPAYWWLSQVLQDEREHCCDDIAINYSGDPMAYAKALTDLEQSRLHRSQLALGIKGSQNHLLGRIKRIMGIKQQYLNMNTRLVTFLVMSISLCGLAWIAPAHLPVIEEITYDDRAVLAPIAAPVGEIELRAVPEWAPESIEEPDWPFAIATVDSPPPPPPVPALPPPPPLPAVVLPALPPLQMNGEEGVPDYLNPEEIPAYRRSGEGTVNEEAMEEYAERMAEWGEKFGEQYSEKMEKYAEQMAKWGEQYEQNYGEEYAKKMEKYGEEMAKWGEEFAKRYSEEYAHEYENMAREIEREVRSIEGLARIQEREGRENEVIEKELREKLREIELQAKGLKEVDERKIREVEAQLRRLQEVMHMKEQELRRYEQSQARGEQLRLREKEIEMQRAEMRMQREEARRRTEVGRRRADENRRRAEEARRHTEEDRRRTAEDHRRTAEVRRREEESRSRVAESALREQEERMRGDEYEIRERYTQLKALLYDAGVINSKKSRVNVTIDEDRMTVNGKKVNRELKEACFRLLDIDMEPGDGSKIQIKFD